MPINSTNYSHIMINLPTPVIPVILCGGSGTRLWPLSRETYPKQFLRLLGDESLLQQTIQRVKNIQGAEPAVLVCNESSRFIAAEQLREIGATGSEIILEPLRRNTAPAIASAALHLLGKYKDPLLLVLPADHVIKDQVAFSAAIAAGKKAAEAGHLVTFGITPTAPETGYGYILAHGANSREAVPIVKFVEKPERATAEKFVASGDYLWNSGMFLFRASRYIEELTKFQPDIVDACTKALAFSKRDLDFTRLDHDAYATSPNIAIDYGVMEHTQNSYTVAMDAKWNDIGSWSSVWDVAEKDANNNATRGDVVLHDCEGCLLNGTTRLITAVGMRNAIVVETPDAVLIMDRDCAQDARTVVEKLIHTKRSEATQHREVFRPWGSYDSIESGSRFNVKRIKVNQGAKLSLQMHHHRAEHWVVVSGTAKITKGDEEYLLTENQSTYIPLGVVHSLENPGKIPLELIEIQSGGYFGEDDIIRFQDRYGRA